MLNASVKSLMCLLCCPGVCRIRFPMVFMSGRKEWGFDVRGYDIPKMVQTGRQQSSSVDVRGGILTMVQSGRRRKSSSVFVCGRCHNPTMVQRRQRRKSSSVDVRSLYGGTPMMVQRRQRRKSSRVDERGHYDNPTMVQIGRHECDIQFNQFNQIYFNFHTSLHVNNYYNTLHFFK